MEHFDFSFDKNGYTEMHYFEEPFEEAYSSGSHLTLLHDLIMHHWIKTNWADGMDVTDGLLQSTATSTEEISHQICRTAIGSSPCSMCQPYRRMNVF